jgi:hypothetical protein
MAPSGSLSSLRRTTTDIAVALPALREIDLFIGGYGNNITKPAETTATQFVVIEDISTSPWLNGNVQIRINTTDYFQNPDVTNMFGIPGMASPYPRGAASTLEGTDQLLKSFDLYPDVYVLPGQTWQILYTTRDGATAYVDGVSTAQVVSAFVKYTLYDGPDPLHDSRWSHSVCRWSIHRTSCIRLREVYALRRSRCTYR